MIGDGTSGDFDDRPHRLSSGDGFDCRSSDQSVAARIHADNATERPPLFVLMSESIRVANLSVGRQNAQKNVQVGEHCQEVGFGKLSSVGGNHTCSQTLISDRVIVTFARPIVWIEQQPVGTVQPGGLVPELTQVGLASGDVCEVQLSWNVLLDAVVAEATGYD